MNSDLNQQVTEPVAEEQSASSAASATSAPKRAPIWRILIVVVLVGLGVASPGLGILTLPFATALLALGLLYGAARAFIVASAIGSVALAVALVATGLDGTTKELAWAGMAAVAALAFIALGVEQRRSMRPDPGSESLAAATRDEWPEPRMDRGLSHALLTWTVAALVLVGLVGVVAGPDDLRSGSKAAVRDAYASYVIECREGGMFAKQDDLCANMQDQRSQVLDLADDHAPSLLAFLAAIFVIGGAGTSHLLVTARARAVAKQGQGVDVRPGYRLRDLELHWSYAYVGVAGIALWMGADAASGQVAEWLLAGSVGLVSIAGFVLLAQGAGLLAWIFTRRKMPLWYKLLLVVMALLVLPGAVAMVALFGIIDMGIHPRRRAAAKAAAN